MKRLLVAVAAVLAVPASAQAAVPSIVSRDVPLRGDRALASQTPRFTLVGLHWQGPGEVEFRTRSVSGRWSAWRPAAPEDEDRPDRDSAEESVPGWNLGNPYWTGPSDALQVRTRGVVRRVRAHYVWSPVGDEPRRTLSLAGSPAIIPRLSWGANELIKRAGPRYARSVRFAIVHHTAGTNAYTRDQSAAIVRGIQTYHVRGNGWNDLGYNFLVDKFGQVFEGRYGGMARNVIGAHAEGFNTGSVGVAVLGTYGAAGISKAAEDALVQLISWRLDVAHVDPLTTFSWSSGGNGRFPRGVPVFLRTISGHRDTGFTACPGDALYRKLDALAARIAQTGLPKIYFPAVRGGLGGPIRFTARLSAAASWTVRVRDDAGNVVAEGSGAGPTVDWTWDATAVVPGSYRWAIESPDALAAEGTIGARGVLSLSRVAAAPAVVSPNGDGWEDSATVAFALGAAATVTATVVDASGATVATVLSEPRTAGEQSFWFTPDSLPDGAYQVVLAAVNGGGKQVTASVPLTVNRTLAGLAPERPLFSPNADGRLDRIGFGFTLAAPAHVKVRVLKDGKWVATPFDAPLGAGPQRVEWDGSKRIGRLLDGAYEVEVLATNGLGTVAQRAPFASDTRKPVLRLASAQPLKVHLSEPAKVVFWINGARREFQRDRAGFLWLKGPARLRTLRIVAWDLAGNVSQPVVRR